MPEQHSYTLINAATATGAGQSKKLPVVTNDHRLGVTFVDADASISVLVVDLEMSLDRPEIPDAAATWFIIGTITFSGAQLLAKAGTVAVLNEPALRIRGCIRTATGIAAGDTVTVKSIHRFMGRP